VGFGAAAAKGKAILFFGAGVRLGGGWAEILAFSLKGCR